MGVYINPKDMSKEAWLDENGTVIPEPTEMSTDETSIVCLINNGMFTAAGVMYSQSELDCFTDPNDTRSKTWYSVPTKNLLDPEVSDLARMK